MNIQIAPKPFNEYTPHEYREYIRSLKQIYVAEQDIKKEIRKLAQVKKSTSPVKDVSFRINLKGTPIITIRNRSPKWISREEIDILARHHSFPMNRMWLLVKDKQITISDAIIQKRIAEIPW